MGQVEAADTHLRAWGSNTNLDVKGMVRATLTTQRGAKTDTKVYIVDGFHPEPLLGDKDAESLGFIVFNPEGRERQPVEVNSIAQKIRDNLQVPVATTGNTIAGEIPEAERTRVEQLIEAHKGLVFSGNRIGKVKTKPIHLEADPDFVPIQPPFYNTPLHYQKEVSEDLQFLREQGAITDIDPSSSKTYDCVLNIVVTDKKDGHIRMNVDATPWNPGMKRTRQQIMKLKTQGRYSNRPNRQRQKAAMNGCSTCSGNRKRVSAELKVSNAFFVGR